MPWLIQHRCNMAQPEPSNYAVVKGERDGRPVSRVLCPNRNCREEFIIDGHEMFAEATQDKATPGLPPGFVIARSRRAT